MKKLLIALSCCAFALSAMQKEKNDTELQVIPLTYEDDQIRIEQPTQTSIPQPAPRKNKKSPTSGWSFAKKIFIGSLLASQGIGLTTDIVGMQKSQSVSSISSPITAYSAPDYWSRPHPANCNTEEEAGYLYPLPVYVRDISCDCGPDENCDECIIETCPDAEPYMDNFSTMYASQIVAIGTRTFTMLGILAGAIGCYNK